MKCTFAFWYKATTSSMLAWNEAIIRLSSTNPVSFTVTFPLLIPPLCLTTPHIVHTSLAAPPRQPAKKNTPSGHLPGTWSRDLASSAPPSTSARRLGLPLSHFTTRHMSCHACPAPSGAFTWMPTTAARRVLLFALAGGGRLPPEALSANGRRPLFSRQPVMSLVHLQCAVCVLRGGACAHVGCGCITAVGGASQLCPLLVRRDRRCVHFPENRFNFFIFF